MKKQIIVNDSIVLSNVELVQGKETKCYHADMLVDGQKIKVTYDLNTGNLVITDWHKLNQNKLPMITELVKAIFREEQEILKMKNNIMNFVTEKQNEKFDISIQSKAQNAALNYIEMNNAKLYIEDDDLVIAAMFGDNVTSTLHIAIDSVTAWTDDCKEFGDYYIESMVGSIF